MLTHTYTATSFLPQDCFFNSLDDNCPDGPPDMLEGLSNISSHTVFSKCTSLSAVGKKSFMDESMDCDGWREKPIRQWTSTDVVQWICDNAKENNYEMENINIDEFRVDGISLLNMSKQDFTAKDGYYGPLFFDALHFREAVEDKLWRTDIQDLQPLKPLDIMIQAAEKLHLASHYYYSDVDHSSEEMKDSAKTREPAGFSGMMPSQSMRDSKDLLTHTYPTNPFLPQNAYLNTFIENYPESSSNTSSHSVISHSSTLSAVGKKSFMDKSIDYGGWRKKPINQWTSAEVVLWICENVKENNYEIENINIDEFRVDGASLLKMSKQDFVSKDGCYGELFFDALHTRKAIEEKLWRNESDNDDLKPLKPSDVMCRNVDCSNSSDSDLDHSDHSSQERKESVKVKKRVGRPRKAPGQSRRSNKGKKCGKVWEFIRDLLLNPQYCPSLIVWENRENGVFRFVRSEEVARLWGKRRTEENQKMTYEKFSRAMRHNYKTEYLQPVLGRRLVYKFGSRATGWQMSNPNFREK